MTIEQFYETINGDYNEVLHRLVNERIVTKFVCKFLQDPTFFNLEEAILHQQPEEAFIAAHTLKGVCLNLGFSQLGKEVAELTELLRPKDDTITSSTVTQLFQSIQQNYHNIISAISQMNQ